MRRLIALVVLAAGGWTPAAGPGCALIAPAGGAPAADVALDHAATHGTPSAHGRGAGVPAGEGRTPDTHRHHPPGCSPGTICGAGMVGAGTPAAQAPAPALTHRSLFPPLRASFGSVIRTQDPPPPRLPV